MMFSIDIQLMMNKVISSMSQGQLVVFQVLFHGGKMNLKMQMKWSQIKNFNNYLQEHLKTCLNLLN